MLNYTTGTYLDDMFNNIRKAKNLKEKHHGNIKGILKETAEEAIPFKTELELRIQKLKVKT